MNTNGIRPGKLTAFGLMVLAACDCDVTGPRVDPGLIGVDGGSTAFEASAPFSIQVPVTEQTGLRLKGFNGTVHIQESVGVSAVEVTGSRRVCSHSLKDAEDQLGMLQVRSAEGAGEILIETVQPQNDGRRYEVDYMVMLPRAMKVYLTNINGNVTLADLTEDAVVHLVNGEVDADLTLPSDGTVDLFTVNGAIDLAIQRDVSARFKATLTHGHISTNNLELHNQVSTALSLTGMLGQGTGLIELGLVNGDINVLGRAPQGSSGVLGAGDPGGR